jgi:ATP-dependent Lhr-like helicase
MLALAEQLEGFEAPAGHWEKYLLPARLESFDPTWLDNLTFFGQVVWGRLNAPSRDANSENGRPFKSLTRSTPIALMLREHLGSLLPEAAEGESSLGGNALAAYECFQRHGALFPNQLGSLLQLVPSQVDGVLGELAAAGLVTSDGYPALRTLIGANAHKKRRYRNAPAMPAGRWNLLRSPLIPSVTSDERTEFWCRLLLRRYGVMFRDLLANESAAPPWYLLVRTYRRLEARGEIRGGRFVADVAGEQYATADVIPILRAAGEEADEKPLVLSATDPLNLSGRIGAGPRIPSLPGQSIVIDRSMQINPKPPDGRENGELPNRVQVFQVSKLRE